MIKKLYCFILALAGLLIASYLFQPIKSSKGVDATSKYVLVTNWLHLPANFKLGNPTGLGIDTNENIIVFCRADRDWPVFGPMPRKPIKSKTILIIDKNNGKLLTSWGDGLFTMPHGLTVDAKNNIWVTDVGLNQVFKFSHEGKLLMKIGEANVSGNDRLHFNKPTDIAVAKDGSFYVSDGYGNDRIIKFSAAGKYLFEWGRKGGKESEFNIPHAICLDARENVYVADRENNRIQVFTPRGKFIKQLLDKTFGAVCSVSFDNPRTNLFAVDDLTFLRIKHRGSDVFVLDTTGKVRTRFGRSGSYEGNVAWYHDLTVDKDENIYVGDILGNSIQKFRKVANP